MPPLAAALRWESICVPLSYLEHAWPLHTADVRGSSLAVAGMRGVAVCDLCSQRWRFLGASGTQHVPFHAHHVRWLSAELLLVVAHSGASSQTSTSTGVGLPHHQLHAPSPDGGGRHGDLQPAPVLLLLRHDLSEVLLRVELDDVPRGELWGCAAVWSVDGAQTSQVLPQHTCVVLGSGRHATVVALGIEEASSWWQWDANAPLRFRASAVGAIELPERGPPGAGLSASLGTVDNARGAGSERIPSADMGVPAAPAVELEVVVSLCDGSVMRAALPLPMLRQSHAPNLATSPHAAAAIPVLPRGAASRLWHAPGRIWALGPAGMIQCAFHEHEHSEVHDLPPHEPACICVPTRATRHPAHPIHALDSGPA